MISGVVLFHFSEDPSIEVFHPHVPSSNPTSAPAVWAIDEARSPLYWFPRMCPRVTCWYRPSTDRARARAAIGATTAPRVHAIEWPWLEAMRSTSLYVYRFDPTPFTPVEPGGGQYTSPETVRPLGVDAVGDLLAKHEEAGIELRLVDDLWALHVAVVASTLSFSGVRLSRSPSYRPDELPAVRAD